MTFKKNIKYNKIKFQRKLKTLYKTLLNEYEDNKILLKLLFNPNLHKKYNIEIKTQLKENLYMGLNLVLFLLPGSVISIYVLNKILKIKVSKTFDIKDFEEDFKSDKNLYKLIKELQEFSRKINLNNPEIKQINYKKTQQQTKKIEEKNNQQSIKNENHNMDIY